MKVLYKQVTWF